jgi:hypothetical protein
LRDLKAEVRRITEHVSAHAPQKWKMTAADRRHPDLAICQITERQDLDRCLAVLASLPLGFGAVYNGSLGDNILITPAPGFNLESFLARLWNDYNILASKNAIPQSREEYFSIFENITGRVFIDEPLSRRQRQRFECRMRAEDWTQTQF